MQDPNRLITVCAECGESSCWLGIFMCGNYLGGGTKEVKRSELDALGKEHPDYYSDEMLLKHTGS